MGSTSFLGFSCPNLLLVFSELLIFRNLYHILSQVLGLSLGRFILFYFSVPYFGFACDHGSSFVCLKTKKEKVLDRGHNDF